MLDTSAGSDEVMMVTWAQDEVLRVLQVADKFLRAGGSNTSSSVRTSYNIFEQARLGLILVYWLREISVPYRLEKRRHTDRTEPVYQDQPKPSLFKDI